MKCIISINSYFVALNDYNTKIFQISECEENMLQPFQLRIIIDDTNDILANTCRNFF